MKDRPRQRRKWIRRLLMVLAILLVFGAGLIGCGGLYFLKLGMGQARILLDRRPIPEVLEDPGVDADVKAKLRLILEVRAFAQEELGLATGKNYRYYFDTGGLPIVYTVTAAAKDRLEPYTWKFPIVGEVPYKGHFERGDAEAEVADLESEGYDTNLGSAQAFSTLGWFSDPVFTSMLERRRELVVETVIHELCHATIYVKDETPFNESLATFVGIAGAVEFLSKKYGEDSEEVRFARAVREDREVFSRIIQELEEELIALYAEAIPLEEKLARREEVFRRSQEKVRTTASFQTMEFGFYPDLKLNNAVVLALLHYHTRIGFFEEVYEKEGKDLGKTIARFARAPEEAVGEWGKVEE